ncbi:MAG: hypothetical protein ACYTGQ_13720, partial [Planctomycetota bacterium]
MLNHLKAWALLLIALTLTACQAPPTIPAYTEAPARFDHLADYFRDANPNLFARIENLKAAYADGRHSRGATYIAGVGGVGKSYLIGQLDLPEDATSVMIKLADLFGQARPDLTTLDGAHVFNTLPYAKTVSIQRLLDRHDAADKAFVLVDDLDEIHPQTAQAILRGVEGYVTRQPSQPRFVHFLVFGRPEAFAP